MAKGTYMDFSETKNWNVARDYSHSKIMKLLYEVDMYERIATFGADEFIDELINSQEMKDLARIKALYRLRKTLEMIINNSLFAIKKKNKGDKELLLKKLEELAKIKKAINSIEIKVNNMRDKKVTIKINEQIFEKILDMLISIKAEINNPLNNSDLIYSSEENFDPEEYQRRIEEELIYGG